MQLQAPSKGSMQHLGKWIDIDSSPLQTKTQMWSLQHWWILSLEIRGIQKLASLVHGFGITKAAPVASTAISVTFVLEVNWKHGKHGKRSWSPPSRPVAKLQRWAVDICWKMAWSLWNIDCHVGSCIHEVESPRLGHCHEIVSLAIPKDMLSHSVRVSMLDVRTFLLFFASIVCSTNPDGHGTDTVKLTKRAMVLWFYHLKPCALISFDQLTQSTWSCLPRREQNTPRSPESGAKFIFCIFLLKIAPFLSGERRPRSRATALGCLKKSASLWIQLTKNWGLQSLLSLLPSVGSAAHGTGECRPCAWCHGFDGVAGIFGL